MDVLIVDDHWLVRDGLAHILESVPDINVEGTDSLPGLFTELRERRSTDTPLPHVVILDACLGEDSGIEAIPVLRAEFPACGVLILSMLAESPHAVRSIEQGAHGFVSKGCPPAELISAIRTVAAGQKYVSPTVARLLADRVSSNNSLTSRESEIVRYYAHGYRCGEIARVMSLSPKTVSTHKANAMRKLCLRTNADLIRWGLDNVV